MTPEAQRIAIAEACPFVEWNGVCPFWRNKRGSIIRFDPLNDLNAMHEAEKVKIIGTEYESDYCMYLYENAHQCFATAAQRAEAFLRTLNLWKD